jgi:hypothetical protein
VPANTRPTAANVKNIFRKSSISLVLLLVNFLFESVEVLNNLSLNYNECLCTSGNFSVSGAENLIKTSLPKGSNWLCIPIGANFICNFKCVRCRKSNQKL